MMPRGIGLDMNDTDVIELLKENRWLTPRMIERAYSTLAADQGFSATMLAHAAGVTCGTVTFLRNRWGISAKHDRDAA